MPSVRIFVADQAEHKPFFRISVVIRPNIKGKRCCLLRIKRIHGISASNMHAFGLDPVRLIFCKVFKAKVTYRGSHARGCPDGNVMLKVARNGQLIAGILKAHPADYKFCLHGPFRQIRVHRADLVGA